MNEEEIKKIEKACEKAVEYLKDNKMPYVSLIIKEDGIKVVQDRLLSHQTLNNPSVSMALI